jgi:histidine ammonia-lyase
MGGFAARKAMLLL